MSYIFKQSVPLCLRGVRPHNYCRREKRVIKCDRCLKRASSQRSREQTHSPYRKYKYLLLGSGSAPEDK